MPERDGLITTAELAAILDHPDLRLFDCTTYLEYQPEGSGVPYIAVPGRHTFEAGHIPGADFLDLQGEFSQANIELHFMMPATAQLEAAFGRHGIGADSRVVLYSIGIGDVGDAVLVDAEIARLRQRRGAGRRARQLEGRGPRDRDRTRERLSAGDLHRKTAGRLFRRQARDAEGQQPTATPSSSTRSTRNCTRAWSRAVTAGPDGFPAASMCRRQRCTIPRQRPSCRWRKRRRNSPRKA